MRRLLISLSVLLLLAACQQILDAEVTRFNTLPSAPTGQSFTILPDRGQDGSLEFQHHADLVADALAARGFHPLPHGASADLVVFLHYGNAGVRTMVYGYEEPAFGTGFATSVNRGGGMVWSGGALPYYRDSYGSYTLYAQFLDVEILDARAYAAGQRQMVFQGRAVGESGIRDVNAAMPYLVRALFDQFPGASGRTVRVEVPIDRG